MKFNIGDKVRLTREAISYKLREQHTIKYSIILWKKITDISKWDDMILVDYIWYKTEYLELVPEEPEFEEWEEIEVSHDKKERNKRIFLIKLADTFYPYTCVAGGDECFYGTGEKYSTETYKYARKRRPSLTRKEIAEKFGVDEDFELI